MGPDMHRPVSKAGHNRRYASKLCYEDSTAGSFSLSSIDNFIHCACGRDALYLQLEALISV